MKKNYYITPRVWSWLVVVWPAGADQGMVARAHLGSWKSPALCLGGIPMRGSTAPCRVNTCSYTSVIAQINLIGTVEGYRYPQNTFRRQSLFFITIKQCSGSGSRSACTPICTVASYVRYRCHHN